MEASSGRFEIKAPVGRLRAASSGRYLTGASVGRHHKASSGRSCQVAPIGRCHQASNGRFNLKAPTGRFHGASNGRFQGEAANGHAADPHCIHPLDASGTPPGRYAWTVRTSVLVEVNRRTVPTPPKFGRPMAVQRANSTSILRSNSARSAVPCWTASWNMIVGNPSMSIGYMHLFQVRDNRLVLMPQQELRDCPRLS
ncbi:hypothetical protein PCANC_11412 [Puccinia coronata f. sp. avenae]|uniref:Uncharacterized protein n=1 Tax=Puccinia coronata f. sp. avenae TaxID=200324 RepID=A0A2N5VMK6_9BASI|nr:hypothetical protein PCASD_23216 [Puccinia coronata f. sp. avenae]PLW51170.1 hypothetical protein PCANC_11412 [Puccinia coronata f. sp. avenae]